MATFIAFLRGINVGGKNKIKMADLKTALEAAGLARVETYIQSGNVIFESDETEEALREKLEREIEERFGVSAAIVLRTSADLERLIRNCPFSGEEIAKAESVNSEGESMYVGLLPKAPAPGKSSLLDAFSGEDDRYRIENRDVYLLFRHSIRNSKLANNLSKLEVPCTTRNWKTMAKLQEMAGARKNG